MFTLVKTNSRKYAVIKISLLYMMDTLKHRIIAYSTKEQSYSH